MIRDATLPLKPSVIRYSMVWGYLVAAFTQIRCWYNIHLQRRALLTLNEVLLKDIGISRTDALAEGSKPFWQW
ncbi:MAG: DUF1127 domain-containing protein [Nitrosomonas ureae]